MAMVMALTPKLALALALAPKLALQAMERSQIPLR
jgi:hypothetical protein